MKWSCYMVAFFLMLTATAGMIGEGANMSVGERILAMMLIANGLVQFAHIISEEHKQLNKK